MVTQWTISLFPKFQLSLGSVIIPVHSLSVISHPGEHTVTYSLRLAPVDHRGTADHKPQG